MPRVVKQDVMVGDVEIKAGTLVNLLLGAANVDQADELLNRVVGAGANGAKIVVN